MEQVEPPDPHVAPSERPAEPIAEPPRFVSADPSAPLPQFAADGEPPDTDPPVPAPGIRQPPVGPLSVRLADGRLANVNRYRGLQLLDVSDPRAPRVDGELAVDAFGFVALHARGSRAFMLVEGLRSYDAAAQVERRSAALLTIDLANPNAPALLDTAPLPGLIRASQLVEQAGRADLIVAFDEAPEGLVTRSALRRFQLGSDAPQAAEDLELGASVTAIGASAGAFLVARADPNANPTGSSVSVIDCSRAGTAMRSLGSVPLAGYVPDASAMSLQAGVLRVLSLRREANWENHLETFSMPPRSATQPALAHCTFAGGHNVREAHFARDRAIFVTDDTTAVVRAFILGAQGTCEERPEYALVPAADESFAFVDDGQRLIGVGYGDTRDRLLISLYDSSNMRVPAPRLGQVAVEPALTWSDVNWGVTDTKVLEQAVSLPDAQGATETGLLLVPYAARAPEHHYVAGMQSVTFSPRGITARGAMEHGSVVHDSVAIGSRATANVSEAELSLFAHEVPGSCAETGRVELAPNFARVFVFGEHLLRVRLPPRARGSDGALSLPMRAEVVLRSQTPETPGELAGFDLNGSASLYQVGSLLLAIEPFGSGLGDSLSRVDAGSGDGRARIDVFDLSQPTSPRHVASAEAELPMRALQNPVADEEAGVFGASWPAPLALPNALVLPAVEHHEELGGSRQVCRMRPASGCQQVERQGHFVRRCFSGETLCSRIDDDPARCTGEIRECNASFGECGVVEGFVPSDQQCMRDYVRTRWNSLQFAVIDLTDPAHPEFSHLAMPGTEHALGAFVRGSDLYYTFDRPLALPDDPRSYAAYFYQRIDLSAPSDPQLDPEVNVPGELLTVAGADLYLRDYAWTDGLGNETEIALRRARHADAASDAQPPAELVASLPLGQADLATLAIDEHGTLAYLLRGDALVVADAATLTTRSKVGVSAAHRLDTLHAGRALLSDGRSLGVVTFDDPDAAKLAVHHLVRGWASATVWADDELFVAAGPYGLQRFTAEPPVAVATTPAP